MKGTLNPNTYYITRNHFYSQVSTEATRRSCCCCLLNWFSPILQYHFHQEKRRDKSVSHISGYSWAYCSILQKTCSRHLMLYIIMSLASILPLGNRVLCWMENLRILLIRTYYCCHGEFYFYISLCLLLFHWFDLWLFFWLVL